MAGKWGNGEMGKWGNGEIMLTLYDKKITTQFHNDSEFYGTEHIAYHTAPVSKHQSDEKKN